MKFLRKGGVIWLPFFKVRAGSRRDTNIAAAPDSGLSLSAMIVELRKELEREVLAHLFAGTIGSYKNATTGPGNEHHRCPRLSCGG
jgi:hypothetical protein